MFAKIIVLLCFLLAVAFAADAPKVKVELYFEAQCPGCQQFTTGALKDVLSKPDMVDIIDLKLVPYGNTKQNTDGSFTCQHGTGECQSDVMEMCVQYKLSGSIASIDSGDTSLAAWPFILCMEQAEGNPAKGQSCYTSTMNTAALPWSTIDACTKNEASVVQAAGAKTTPKHDYVPWPLVDHKLLENTNLLQQTICNAYNGTKPASCRKFVDGPSGACSSEW